MSELRVNNIKTVDSSYEIATEDISSRDVNIYEIVKGKYFPKVNCVDHGDIAEVGSLAYIISQAAGSDRQIELGPGSYTLGTNLTIPATCALRFNKNAVIACTGDLIINGSLEAGNYQIFSGTGTVTLGIYVEKTYKAWGTGTKDSMLQDITDDHVITLPEKNRSFRLKAGANKQFTLPSVGEDEDGIEFEFIKGDTFKLTILAADTDTIADSSGGGTIYNSSSEVGALIILKYYHAITKWCILGNGTWITT